MQKSSNEEKFKNQNQNSKNQTLKSISKIQTLNSKFYSGITLIALVVTIVVLLILAGVTITLLFGDNNIFDLAKDAADTTNTAIEDEKTAMEGLDQYIKDNAGGTGNSGGGSGEDPDVPETPEEPSLKPSNDEENIEGVTFKTDFGKIDIIWLEGTTNNPSSTQTPNSPANYLNGMQPVKWDGTTEDDTITATDPDWYSYNAATGTTDNTASHWANAKTTGTTKSYFVWIPRYAYRITYYDVDPNTNPDTAQATGYYDGYGMWRASDGALKCKLETDTNGNKLVETINYNGEKYIVHPALTTNLDMGGWSENLPGFWFAKFEMSGSSSSTLASVPGVSSYRSATIGTFYTTARSATYGMTGTVDSTANGGDGNTSFMNSHMAKNSEWGAVAYLTHSKYGRNGYEIDMNKNSSYYTGGAVGDTAYTGTSNQLQSTTGNPYGVYDMRGGAWEYVASFDKNSSSLTNGNSFTSTKTSTKYATAYNGTTTNSGSPAVYNVCKTGDGIKEVYVSGSTGWHSDYSSFAYSSNPFFFRGGSYGSFEAYTGVFYSIVDSGGSSSYGGFRAVVCP